MRTTSDLHYVLMIGETRHEFRRDLPRARVAALTAWDLLTEDQRRGDHVQLLAVAAHGPCKGEAIESVEFL